ncbi:MAG: penicillin-binding protein 2 [Rhodospirillaceae bacterium]|nr:penicillin-binding protein 2 [Rhodospirillaceae bacterium]|tara:strand:- start:59 stop:1918 length:1860 start_codon:yes stop_codon:yes gene_type:complete
MRQDIDQRKQFTRRALFLAGGQFLLVSGLVTRLYQLQVVDASDYEVLAEENRINVRLLPPLRGLIVDRFGEGMAINRRTYQLVLISEQTDSVPETLERIASLISLSERDVHDVLREVSRRSDFVSVTVREDLSWTDVTKIEVNLPALPGVLIETGQSRFYPYGELAAHLTGYVSAVSEVELTGERLLELPGFRTGKNGVEKVFELDLRGSAGTRHVEVNAYGHEIRELNRIEGDSGDDLRLTVDMGLQAFAARRLGEETGSVAVLDLLNGDVLALVSTPSFDPNAFNYGLSSEVWQGLLNDPRTPLINKPIAGQYPPGSTFKMIVALAALEHGVVTPDEDIYCPGFYELGNHTFGCWRHWGHGHVDMVEAHKVSCDVYFYEIAHRVGVDNIAEMASRFGLGMETGIELTGEESGLIPTKAWKEAVLGEGWLGGETVNAGIGQGHVLATPLQLGVMAARLGNGRVRVKPRLARSAASPAIPLFEPLRVNEEHLEVVRQGMYDVVNNPDGGTAFRARIEDEGMEMAGKTGTAQVRRMTAADREANRSLEEIPWNERDHALFVAYAPLQASRYACAVVVDHGGGGSTAAAPIARDVLREAQRRESVRWPMGEDIGDPLGQDV